MQTFLLCLFIGLVVAIIIRLSRKSRVQRCAGCLTRIEGHYVTHDGAMFCHECANACALKGCRCHTDFKCHND